MPDKVEKENAAMTADNTIQSPSLALDIDKYRPYLKDSDLTDQQAEELLRTLWHIMQTMVNIGWGVDTLNIMLPELFNQQAPQNNDTETSSTKGS